MFKKIFGKPKIASHLNNVEEIICNIIRNLSVKNTITHENLNHDSRFDSIGLSSLNYIEFFSKLELALKIDMERLLKIDFASIVTIGDMALALRLIK